MKKTYSKPQIVIENFTLSTNVAGDCEQPYTLQAQFICAIPDTSGAGLNLFSTAFSGDCNVDGNGNTATYDGFCYHIPSEKNQLFNS